MRCPALLLCWSAPLYNIVDQIFIGQGVGYYGNAATNVAYPLTTICLAIALLIGIGSASGFSLQLGAGNPDAAAKAVGNAIVMMFTFGILYFVIIQVFLDPMLIAFGATDKVFSYAESYTRITALGMPLLIVMNGMSNLAARRRKPEIFYEPAWFWVLIINTVLDPIFIFCV